MNLRTALRKAPDDEVIFVGSRSSYVAIGTKEEILKMCPKIDEFYRFQMWEGYLNAVQRSESEKDEKMKEMRKRMAETCLARYVYTIQQPFLKRDVIESEPILQGWKIKVTGFEEGRFWFQHEYEDGKKVYAKRKRLQKQPPSMEELR